MDLRYEWICEVTKVWDFGGGMREADMSTLTMPLPSTETWLWWTSFHVLDWRT